MNISTLKGWNWRSPDAFHFQDQLDAIHIDAPLLR